MRKIKIVLLLNLFSIIAFSQQNENPSIAFDFLKGFQNVRDITLSKNQNEVYFTIQSPLENISKIAFSKKVNNNWTQPELVPFTSAFRDIEPFLSFDELRLYFASNRPLSEEETNNKDYDIWYVERKNITSSWSKPINIGHPINTDKDEFYPSVAKNGNLYFTSENDKSLGKDDIFVSLYLDGKFGEPQNIGTNINTEGYEFNAFVSPDESFLIFTGYNREDGNGSGDLYISYNVNGKCSLAKNLSNKINSKQMDYCPFYDATTKTLYFTSKRNNTNDSKFDTINEFIKEITKSENGLSRIYKYKITL